jgi:hypothetical protein
MSLVHAVNISTQIAADNLEPLFSVSFVRVADL